jgi:hypothetical protein
MHRGQWGVDGATIGSAPLILPVNGLPVFTR